MFSCKLYIYIYIILHACWQGKKWRMWRNTRLLFRGDLLLSSVKCRCKEWISATIIAYWLDAHGRIHSGSKLHHLGDSICIRMRAGCFTIVYNPRVLRRAIQFAVQRGKFARSTGRQRSRAARAGKPNRESAGRLLHRLFSAEKGNY